MKIAAAQYPIGFFRNWDDWKKNVETWVEKSEDADIFRICFDGIGESFR